MTRLFDNIEDELGEHLQKTLAEFDRMDAAVGYFNLRGWRVFDELVAAKPFDGERPTARILIGMSTPAPHDEAIDDLQSQVDSDLDHQDAHRLEADQTIARARRAELLSHLRTQLMRGVPSPLDRATLKSMRAMLESGRLRVKVFTRRPLHGKTYIFHRTDLNNPITGFVGSSNLTTSGLRHNLELNVDVVDHTAALKLAGWFQDRWDDPFSRDITADLLDLLDESWATPHPRPPYEVFLKVCYDLSRDVREGLAEFSVPKDIRDKLLPFQQTAVRTLARRIISQRGAMLGDVVGLGKTLTAIAAAMMLREEYNYQPLVLCPKNLVTMWQTHFEAYDLHGAVVPFSMAAKELPTLRRYPFVVIDEAHTLRSDTRADYQAIKAYISDNESRVLLLTATPYNREFRDVGNQLGLYIDDDQDLGIAPENALAVPGSKIADRVDNQITTLRAFKLSDDPGDWQRLMNQHLIRRTRSFIRSNYAETDGDGRDYLKFSDGTRFTFPDRLPRPRQHSFGPDDPATKMTSAHTIDVIDHLIFPRYELQRYVRTKASMNDIEQAFVDKATQGRGHVAGFVRTTFFKRLSSSGQAFVTTLQRHLARNDLFSYAITEGLPVPAGTIDDSQLEPHSESGAEPDDTTLIPAGTPATQYQRLVELDPPNITWLRPNVFTNQLAADLATDSAALRALLTSFGPWSPATDSKLQDLISLIRDEHSQDKVLIFTEYKDTANYINKALAAAGIAEAAAVTGDTDDPTTFAIRFSPGSNRDLEGRAKGKDQTPTTCDPLRVLVATDVLSEGQNLQDAHIIVNYDLPWAIIRLIQRAGRIDRIGQKADQVLVYSYFHESLDAVIRLRQRIADRLSANAQAFGSDERFFGTEAEVKTLTDLYSGESVPDADDDLAGDLGIDPVSLAFTYWQQAPKEHPEITAKVEGLPDLIDATRKTRPGEQSGLVCYTRTESGLDGFGYATAPDELRLLSGREALELFRVDADEPARKHRPDHDQLLTTLVHGPLASPDLDTAGRLRGVRQRIYKRLGEDLLHTQSPDVQKALDALFQNALTPDAERRLSRALRRRASNQELAELVAALHADGSLIKATQPAKDRIRIVSSMGIAE